MLSHPKHICRTVPRIQRQLRLRVLAIVFCWSALLFCCPQESVAQDDYKFREFDRKMVHSPRELARDLNSLFFRDKKNPLADIDPEKLKKLKELGNDFFENLDDDQKKKARDFAEKFMRDKGLNSHEGKQLMDQLGVSPEMQSELAKEFGDKDPTDFERFRDLFKNSDRSSGEGKNGSHNDEAWRPGKQNESVVGELEPHRPENFRGKSGQPKAARKDRPKDLFETLPNELENKSGGRDGQPGDQAKGKSAGDLEKQISDAAKKANADRDGKLLPEDGIPDESLNRDSPNAERQKKLADLKTLEQQLDANTKGQQRGSGKQSKGGNGARRADGKSLADKNRELGKELLEDLKGQNAEGGGQSALEDVLKELDRLKANKSADSKTADSKRGSKKAPKVGGVDGQANRELDETFKSWIQMEAIKKGLKEFREGRPPTDFQRRSLESVFKKGFKELGQSIGNGNGSSEEFSEKLDRVLFEAAKDSVQDGVGQSGDSEDGGVVKSTLEGLFNRASDAAKKRKEERRQREYEKMIESQQNPVRQIPIATDSPSQSENGSNPVEYGTEALGAAAEMLEGIPELPAFEPKKILMYLAIAAIAVLLLYLLLRKFSVGQPSTAAQKFGRSFRGAKIRSPKDLVEAVDYFIVQKFGGRSQWWNAKHAQDMLCAGAPGYSAKISELLKDYVRARYTRADVTLSAEEQLNYKKTLQELSKEVPGDSQLPAEASQDQG